MKNREGFLLSTHPERYKFDTSERPKRGRRRGLLIVCDARGETVATVLCWRKMRAWQSP